MRLVAWPGRFIAENRLKKTTHSQKSNAKASLVFLPGQAEDLRRDYKSKPNPQKLQKWQPYR